LKLFRLRFWLWAALAVLFVCLPTLSTFAPNNAGADVQALVAFGPRVPETPASEQARTYLIGEYREAGYVTEIGTFTYPKFEDRGSSLTVEGIKIEGRGLNGSAVGQLTAPLVVVPGVGRPNDFVTVNVKGAIAIIRRGEIPFFEKARNAAQAGAVGVAIVNTNSNELFGTLGEQVDIPVLGLSGTQGEPLLKKASTQTLRASLNVNARINTITGHNLIAHLPDVKQPKILLGAHYDSVAKSPGANDNASGTAVILELARRFANTPVSQQAWFVAFDGEEDGLQGSKAFVKTAQPQFLSNLQAMLNFDMVGINDQLLVGGTQPLTALAKKVDPKISTIGETGGSDHKSFSDAKVPVIFFYRGQDPNYHSPNDTVVDPKLLEATAQVAQSLIRDLLESSQL
jgi:aminopeptidase YwaD